LAKSAYFSTPLWRFLLPIMKFDKNIAHLSFITGAIKSVKADGAVVEIGVGGGGTSIVINKFMEEESINRPFYAIDTFYGFTKEDADFERKERGKTDRYLGYRSNSKDWYTKTLIAHGIRNARAIQQTRLTMAPDTLIANFAHRGELPPRLCMTISASSENADRNSGAAEVPPNAWSAPLASIQTSSTH
jgi:hypothetical protein